MGALLGGWRGYTSTPLIRMPTTDCPALPARSAGVQSADQGDTLGELIGESWAENLELAGRIGTLERLLDELHERGVAPSTLAKAAIARMSDEQIYLVLDRVSSIRRHHLAEIQDLRAFATRLAEIGLSGTLVDGDGQEAEPGSGAIYFSSERYPEGSETIARTRFSSDERSIYATIDVGPREGEPILLKWIRVDDPQIIMLRRLKLYSGDREHLSFGMHRDIAREPGDYLVEVYSGDEALEPIARGSYAVE